MCSYLKNLYLKIINNSICFNILFKFLVFKNKIYFNFNPKVLVVHKNYRLKILSTSTKNFKYFNSYRVLIITKTCNLKYNLLLLLYII